MTSSELNDLQLEYLVLKQLDRSVFKTLEEVRSEATKDLRQSVFSMHISLTLKRLCKEGKAKERVNGNKEAYLITELGKRTCLDLMEMQELSTFDGMHK